MTSLCHLTLTAYALNFCRPTATLGGRFIKTSSWNVSRIYNLIILMSVHIVVEIIILFFHEIIEASPATFGFKI